MDKKFFVFKKFARSVMGSMIICNILLGVFIFGNVFLLIMGTNEVFSVVIILLIVLLSFNIPVFFVYRQGYSYIQFSEKTIECSFGNKMQRGITYQDIKEYGVVWYRGERFIYVSKVQLTDRDRYNFIYDMYRKKKDVIALMYQEEALQILKEKMMAQNNHATYYET